MTKNEIRTEVGGYEKLAQEYWELSSIWQHSAIQSTSIMSVSEMIDRLNILMEKGVIVSEVINRQLLGQLAANMLQEVIIGEGKLHPEASDVYKLFNYPPEVNENVNNSEEFENQHA